MADYDLAVQQTRSRQTIETILTLSAQEVAGVQPSRTLHAAASELREAGNPPFDWAPFILTGKHGFRN